MDKQRISFNIQRREMAEDNGSSHEMTEGREGPGYEDAIGDVVRYHRRPICNECENELNYPYNGKKGRGIIFINTEFKKSKPRVGAKNDRKYLEGIYDRYNVNYKDDVHMDLETKDLTEKKLKDFAKSVPYDCPLIMVSFSTHGIIGGKLKMRDEEKMSVEYIVERFTKIVEDEKSDMPKFLNVPKVFIFQACRGRESEVQYSDTDGDDEEAPPRYATERSDVILVYSTSEGYTSFRAGNEEHGSWFLQVLHSCVTAPAYRNLHFVEILTVSSSLMIDFFHKKPDKNENNSDEKRHYVTQTPGYYSTLRKFLRAPLPLVIEVLK